MYRSNRRRGGADVYLTLLLAQLLQRIAQLEYKPPLTLAIIAGCFLTFFDEILPWPLRSRIPPVTKACLQPYMILQNRQWSRLFWAAFLHADEHIPDPVVDTQVGCVHLQMHLYYNMSSMLWKGVQLERRYGTGLFGALLLELLLLSHGMFVALAWLAAYYVPEYSHMYLHNCAIGISAVLFALKVVLNNDSPTYSSIMGITLPTKYMAWAELLLASVLNPRASFLGHLAGIFAGLLHARVLAPAMPALARSWRQARLQARIRMQPGQGRFAAASHPGSRSSAVEWRASTAAPSAGRATRPAAAAAVPQVAAAPLQQRQAAGLQQGRDRNAVEHDRGHRLGGAAAADEVLVHSSSTQMSAEELRLRRLQRFNRDA